MCKKDVGDVWGRLGGGTCVLVRLGIEVGE